ncbi:MAG: NAD(P)/FAD-dependent oxidoreductase [Massilia sp.]
MAPLSAWVDNNKMESAPASNLVYDTLIIGGGPGGLTAAIYLRRFMRSVALFDKGHSRLSLIPVSHNYPGFPEGVPGQQLLDNLRCQLGRYGGAVTDQEILSLRIDDGHFVGSYDGGEVRALTVLLATGIADAGLPVENWREAVAEGAVRLCPVCDGYDVLDKKVAVVSSETNPVGHALFMRTFTTDVLLFARAKDVGLSDDDRAKLEAASVRYIASPVAGVTMSDKMRPILHTEDGEHYRVDVLYPMLGESARSELAAQLGAELADCAEIIVDDHQCTSVPGLYAIGDVVRGLNQISVAAGQAAVAATRIHNTLPWSLRTLRT